MAQERPGTHRLQGGGAWEGTEPPAAGLVLPRGRASEAGDQANQAGRGAGLQHSKLKGTGRATGNPGPKVLRGSGRRRRCARGAWARVTLVLMAAQPCVRRLAGPCVGQRH